MAIRKYSSLVVAMILVFAGVVPAAVALPFGPSRTDNVLTTGWRFHLGDLPGAADGTFDDATWAPVTVPHTWNAADGADGGGDYRRDVGRYRTRLAVPRGEHRLYLQFDGANLVADVYVGGRHAGRTGGQGRSSCAAKDDRLPLPAEVGNALVAYLSGDPAT